MNSTHRIERRNFALVEKILFINTSGAAKSFFWISINFPFLYFILKIAIGKQTEIISLLKIIEYNGKFIRFLNSSDDYSKLPREEAIKILKAWVSDGTLNSLIFVVIIRRAKQTTSFVGGSPKKSESWNFTKSWFPVWYLKANKETLKGKRVCFERRVDYVILIVYSHLNFNLIPFRKISPSNFSIFMVFTSAFLFSVERGIFPITCQLNPILFHHPQHHHHRTHAVCRLIPSKSHKMKEKSLPRLANAFRELFLRAQWCGGGGMQRMIVSDVFGTKSDSHDAGN